MKIILFFTMLLVLVFAAQAQDDIIFDDCSTTGYIIQGVVYSSTNRGIPNIRIHLLDEELNLVEIQFTNRVGAYQFQDLLGCGRVYFVQLRSRNRDLRFAETRQKVILLFFQTETVNFFEI